MNLDGFQITSAVVHDIPRGGDENEALVLTDAPISLDSALRAYFRKKMIKSLGRSRRVVGGTNPLLDAPGHLLRAMSDAHLGGDSDPDRWRDRGIPEQLIAMATATLRLADRPGLRDLGRCVHMLGFRGHFVTKSRRYSTTLGELRAARATHRARQDEPPDDAAVNDNDPTVVLSVWQYLGCGYLNPGDALLAAGVEASLRAAREALLDLRCGPP